MARLATLGKIAIGVAVAVTVAAGLATAGGRLRSAAGALRVCVENGSGDPVPGARVVVFGSAGPPLVRARAGKDGCCRLDLPAGGEVMLVRADGRSPALLSLEDGRDAGERKVELGAPLRLRVRLVDAADGRPVPEWRFLAEPSAEAWHVNPWVEREAVVAGAARSRGDGVPVELEGLPGPAADLVFIAAGYQPAFYHVEGDSASPAVVRLQSEGCVAVTVVDGETGKPVAGVRAVPRAFLPGEPGREDPATRRRFSELFEVGTSDREGRMVLCPPGGRPSPFVFFSDDHVPLAVPVDPAAGRAQRVELHRPASWELTVLERDTGRPLPGVPVRIEAGDAGFARQLATAADGKVTFDRVPGRTTCSLAVMVPGGTDVAWRTSGTLAPGERRRDTVFVEVARSVRVVLGGEPAAGCPVALLDPAAGELPRVIEQSVVDEEGTARFLSRTIPEGALLAVRRESCLLAEELPRPRPGRRSAILDLPGREAALRVVDAADGKPVRGAMARCVEPGGGAVPAEIGAARGDEKGPFWFRELGVDLLPGDPGALAIAGADGRMRVFIPRECGAVRVEGSPALADVPYRPRKLPVRELGDSETVVELEAVPGIRLVPTFAGEGPQVVTVDLRPPDSPWLTPVSRRVRPRPVLRLAAKDRGPWLVVVRAPGYAPAVEGPVEAGSDWPELPVHLAPGGFLEVAGLGAGGSRPGVWSVSGPGGLDWAPWVEASVEEGEDGNRKLRIGPLPPGEWIFAADGCERSARVRFPGDVAKVTCN